MKLSLVWEYNSVIQCLQEEKQLPDPVYLFAWIQFLRNYIFKERQQKQSWFLLWGIVIYRQKLTEKDMSVKTQRKGISARLPSIHSKERKWVTVVEKSDSRSLSYGTEVSVANRVCMEVRRWETNGSWGVRAPEGVVRYHGSGLIIRKSSVPFASLFPPSLVCAITVWHRPPCHHQDEVTYQMQPSQYWPPQLPELCAKKSSFYKLQSLWYSVKDC